MARAVRSLWGWAQEPGNALSFRVSNEVVKSLLLAVERENEEAPSSLESFHANVAKSLQRACRFGALLFLGAQIARGMEDITKLEVLVPDEFVHLAFDVGGASLNWCNYNRGTFRVAAAAPGFSMPAASSSSGENRKAVHSKGTKATVAAAHPIWQPELEQPPTTVRHLAEKIVNTKSGKVAKGLYFYNDMRTAIRIGGNHMHLDEWNAAVAALCTHRPTNFRFRDSIGALEFCGEGLGEEVLGKVGRAPPDAFSKRDAKKDFVVVPSDDSSDSSSGFEGGSNGSSSSSNRSPPPKRAKIEKKHKKKKAKKGDKEDEHSLRINISKKKHKKA
jgi:hypothetical protein